MIRERLLELHRCERSRLGASEGSLAEARVLCACVLDSYWRAIQTGDGRPLKIGGTGLYQPPELDEIPRLAQDRCRVLGEELAGKEPVEAGYELGTTYAALLPKSVRAEYGVYYTPPPVARRLLDLAEQSGADLATATVLDPACGGGAFVATVVEQVKARAAGVDSTTLLKEVGRRVRGYEIDEFSAWMSQVFAEAVLLDDCRKHSIRLPQIVFVRDSLGDDVPAEKFDLVIGNPPYGRVKLGERDRQRFGESVYGHANQYGLFTDQAVRLSKPDGLIAYVTPTSMLAGEYFKRLRELLCRLAPPVRIELLDARKGVFDGVLQETMLSVYRRAATTRKVAVSLLSSTRAGRLTAQKAGTATLPFDPTAPWLLPRTAADAKVLLAASKKRLRLRDFGYRVKTGPLVWNRHKSQLRSEREPGVKPLIWSECIGPDRAFEFRATKRNHEPYLLPSPHQDWLVTGDSCVLVQRTTAKEQSRRLVAAVLPDEFIAQHDGVVVENHLNMILPVDDRPTASLQAIATFLNSAIADQLFRCLNGSVAVSAYEIEALPMPSFEEMSELEDLVRKPASSQSREEFLKDCYNAS